MIWEWIWLSDQDRTEGHVNVGRVDKFKTSIDWNFKNHRWEDRHCHSVKSGSWCD